MIIPCPYCGPRDSGEFQRRGEVCGARPDQADGAEAFVDHVFIRSNPAGPTDEYWFHDAGCRQWLIVRRDTRDHAVLSAAFCRDARS